MCSVSALYHKLIWTDFDFYRHCSIKAVERAVDVPVTWLLTPFQDLHLMMSEVAGLHRFEVNNWNTLIRSPNRYKKFWENHYHLFLVILEFNITRTKLVVTKTDSDPEQMLSYGGTFTLKQFSQWLSVPLYLSEENKSFRVSLLLFPLQSTQLIK